MDMKLRQLVIITIFVSTSISIYLPFAAAESQGVGKEKEFSYEIGSEKGPERWGSIDTRWATCDNGRMQSPIDLMDSKVEEVHHLGKLKRTYHASPATLINKGHDIMLKWVGGAGGIWLNGTQFVLKQLHWHSPSEHTINGRRFDAELHMVHESADGKIAVVGIVYTTGRPDSFLAKLERYIRKIRDVKNGEEDAGIVDPRHIRRGSRKYYRYMGSLTTPPCTQGVVWTIVSKVRTVSKRQIRLLRDAVDDDMENNARPTQPRNGRPVYYYRPWKIWF